MINLNRSIRVSLFSCLAAASMTLAASAQSCVELTDSVPELEIAKSSFADGDYGSPIEFMAGLSASESEIEGFRGQMLETYPNGFEFCETVISRSLSSKFREEVIVLGEPGKEVVYLHWQAANFHDEWIVLSFVVTTNFLDIEGF
ncbi:hypothetical protein K3729_07615 [Rhodobacteraceae bacterium S2214]|nr:hypothetical protein K3729_07615 [Rhodobacteraceae bacterium S2214]